MVNRARQLAANAITTATDDSGLISGMPGEIIQPLGCFFKWKIAIQITYILLLYTILYNTNN